ncbi:hypothetical protein BC835DRAFT_246582 [Cytidiella melzeri]|nr:hypothetical protein BC835DRAFT_246582 [Cytidiella melzeri]
MSADLVRYYPDYHPAFLLLYIRESRTILNTVRLAFEGGLAGFVDAPATVRPVTQSHSDAAATRVVIMNSFFPSWPHSNATLEPHTGHEHSFQLKPRLNLSVKGYRKVTEFHGSKSNLGLKNHLYSIVAYERRRLHRESCQPHRQISSVLASWSSRSVYAIRISSPAWCVLLSKVRDASTTRSGRPAP